MIKDWKGNEIKPGMECCFIETKRYNHGFIGMESIGPISWLIPSTGENITLPEQEQRGWWPSDYFKVVLCNGILGWWTTHETPIGTVDMFNTFSFAWIDDCHLLAIKGISDMHPTKGPL